MANLFFLPLGFHFVSFTSQISKLVKFRVNNPRLKVNKFQQHSIEKLCIANMLLISWRPHCHISGLDSQGG